MTAGTVKKKKEEIKKSKKKSEKVRVLVVDDEKPLNDLYSARLEMEGYEIFNAYDGEEALEVITSQAPDVVLLDLMMPRVSGIDVLEVLKSTPKLKDIPVIILTAIVTKRKVGKKYHTAGTLIKGESSLQDVVNEVNRVVREYCKK